MKKLIAGNTCRSCKHFHDGGGQNPHCRRFPAQVIVMPTQTNQGLQPVINAAFPPVAPDETYCGEFLKALVVVR